MITFRREELVTKNYKCSIKKFMDLYYAGAMLDYNDDKKLLIYVDSYIHGSMSFAFEILMIKGMDLDDKSDVEMMIRRAYR